MAPAKSHPQLQMQGISYNHVTLACRKVTSAYWLSTGGLCKKKQYLTTLLVLFMCITQFLHSGVEDAYANFRVTYAVKALNWTTIDAAHMHSLFYGAYTCGGAIGILISNFFDAGAILWCEW